MFTREEIESIVEDMFKNQQGKTKAEILEKGFANIAIVLDDNAEFYLSFGPFWWNIKRLFPKYVKDNNNWYCSGKFDQKSIDRFSYGDDFLDYAVAIYYSNQHNTDNQTTHYLPMDTVTEYEKYELIDNEAPSM